MRGSANAHQVMRNPGLRERRRTYVVDEIQPIDIRLFRVIEFADDFALFLLSSFSDRRAIELDITCYRSISGF